LLQKWLGRNRAKGGSSFCEVGAGKSLLAESLAMAAVSPGRLIITDSSAAMLSYSRPWAGTHTYLVLNDATRLALADHRFDLLVSSLGDPYNVQAFWDGVYRVLKSGGLMIFTTPADAWAKAFRTNSHSDLSLAQFDLRDGESVDVSSRIYPKEKQIEIIEKSGLHFLERSVVTISEIRSTELSPKLMLERGSKAEIVEGYLITKP
jgi:ubiquinone/menaquinone biosynthesis C-methylase UbiE